MTAEIILGKKRITRDSMPYVIAEIGVNHEGKLSQALELIDLAKEGGADAAKFQTYKAEKLASKYSPAYWDTKKEPTLSQFELFKKYDSFKEKDYKKLANHCEDINIDLPFICENGGGIYAPKDIFPKNHRYRDRFCIVNESERIKNNNKFDFEEIKKIFSDKIIFLKDLSVGEQIKLSGLDEKSLLSAMNREFTEIVIVNSFKNVQKDFTKLLNF